MNKVPFQIAVAIALLVVAPTAVGQKHEPSLALDGCIAQAARHHNVNATTLKAMIYQESWGRADVIRRNSNGSVDYGAAGINSVHLPELAKHGIGARALLDGCTSVYIGAWKYSKKIAKHGNTWRAVGAYHSETPKHRDRYANQILAHLIRWGYYRIN